MTPHASYRLRILAAALAVLAAAVAGAALTGSRAAATTENQSVGLTAGIPWRHAGAAGGDVVFYTATAAHVAYGGEGRVTLAGSADASSTTLVGGELVLTVRHPDSTAATFRHDYCAAGQQALRPRDVTNLFVPGVNSVTLRLSGSCGNEEGSSPIWLVAPPVVG
jgi:hypothetical protein